MNNLMILLYLLFITASILLTLVIDIEKKESFLSTAFDLSLMLLVFHYGIDHILITIAGLMIIITTYFIITYFAIIKKANSLGISHKIVEQVKKGSYKTYISIIFILLPLAFESKISMIICLIIYIIIDRVLFYNKYRSFI